MFDASASFSLQYVSQTSPTILYFDVAQALTNGMANSPVPVLFHIGVQGSNTGTVTASNFPSDIYHWDPPGTPYYFAMPTGNYKPPALIGIDITGAIQSLESQGFDYAVVFIGTGFNLSTIGPPTAVLSFATIPEPSSLILLAIGAAGIIPVRKFIGYEA
jgi:hypothetical protein